MEDIKVGEYVRSLVNGNISKVLEISDLLEEPNVKYYKTGTFTGFCSTENYNVKHSPNIIDLIEVGDYVNGYLIDYIDSERRYLRSERPYREDSTMYKDLIEKGRNYNQCLHFFAEDIKSIATKEQFDSIKYEV